MGASEVRWVEPGTGPGRVEAALQRLREDRQRALSKSEADALAVLLIAAQRAVRDGKLPDGVLAGWRMAVIELSDGPPPGTGWAGGRGAGRRLSPWSGSAASPTRPHATDDPREVW
jgi:hypothetical protein